MLDQGSPLQAPQVWGWIARPWSPEGSRLLQAPDKIPRFRFAQRPQATHLPCQPHPPQHPKPDPCYSLGMACACLPFAHTLLLPGMLFSVPTVLSVPLGFTYVLLGGETLGWERANFSPILQGIMQRRLRRELVGKGAFSPANQAF